MSVIKSALKIYLPLKSGADFASSHSTGNPCSFFPVIYLNRAAIVRLVGVCFIQNDHSRRARNKTLHKIFMRIFIFIIYANDKPEPFTRQHKGRHGKWNICPDVDFHGKSKLNDVWSKESGRRVDEKSLVVLPKELILNRLMNYANI